MLLPPSPRLLFLLLILLQPLPLMPLHLLSPLSPHQLSECLRVHHLSPTMELLLSSLSQLEPHLSPLLVLSSPLLHHLPHSSLSLKPLLPLNHSFLQHHPKLHRLRRMEVRFLLCRRLTLGHHLLLHSLLHSLEDPCPPLLRLNIQDHPCPNSHLCPNPHLSTQDILLHPPPQLDFLPKEVLLPGPCTRGCKDPLWPLRDL